MSLALTAGHFWVRENRWRGRSLPVASVMAQRYRFLVPAEQDQLLRQYGCGLTTAIARPSRRVDELTGTELASAGDALRKKKEKYGLKWIAFLGKGAYSAIMARRDGAGASQPKTVGGARVWVLPDIHRVRTVRI
jgi:TDG/mug DNA glycosylase family protein